MLLRGTKTIIKNVLIVIVIRLSSLDFIRESKDINAITMNVEEHLVVIVIIHLDVLKSLRITGKNISILLLRGYL